jgi:hypothetical protein
VVKESSGQRLHLKAKNIAEEEEEEKPEQAGMKAAATASLS